MRALLSEWRLPLEKWPYITKFVQAIIPHATLKRLGRNRDEGKESWLSPIEVFPGSKSQAFLVRPAPLKEFAECETIDEERAPQIANVCQLHKVLQRMHKEVAASSLRVWTNAQKLHNARIGVMPVNVQIGDFELIWPNKSRRQKLSSEWVGPMTIIDAKSDLVLVVESLFRSERQTAHVHLLMPYLAQQPLRETAK